MPEDRYLVIPNEKTTALFGVDTERGHLSFDNKSGVAYVKEKSHAEELEARYGEKGSKELFVFKDDKYAHALNGESWDMVRNQKGGDDVKVLHQYSQLVYIWYTPLTWLDKFKGEIKKHPSFFSWMFHYWSFINHDFKREIGLRLFGREWSWVLEE